MAESRFADVLHERASRDPAAAAILCDGQAFTGQDLARRCDQFASFLVHEAGVRPGDRVAWLGANDPAQLVLLFALARIGAILLPLNFRLAPPEWDAQLRLCTPGLLVHDEAWRDAAALLAQRHAIPAVPATRLACEGPAAEERSRPDAPVLLVFTSGTTGAPKAAVHTQSNLIANMQIAARTQALTREDRVLTVLPLFHVGGLCIQTLPALAAGAQVELHRRFAPTAVFEALEQRRSTLTLQVPATMKALIDHPRWHASDLSGLRALWAGSSLIPTPLVEAFHARGVPVCNVYGSTETGPFSIALGPQHARTHVGSCGWPAAGVQARLGEGGEVLVRGPNVVGRYWPDEAACDGEGWFHTGDLARQAADGSFTIDGRAKELVISGGENIHPAEVEAALALHEGVVECAAFGMPDREWGEVVAIAVVARGADEAQLRAHLQARIARYKMPRRWYFVDSLPKTALGKVQRGALARLAQAQQQDER